MGPLGSVAGFLIGAITPSPSIGEVLAAARPSPYSMALPSQVAHAAATGQPGGLARNLTGRSGGEDWPDEETAGDVAASAGLEHITAGLSRRAPMPASWYAAHLPDELVEGRGTGYVTDAYNKGFVDLRAAGNTSWGSSAGYGASRPNVQTATLLEPTATTPKPRDMADRYQTENRGHTRLSDMFGD